MADKFKLLSKQYQSEFDHKYACWASNHRGWQKMKKRNKRIARKKLKEELNKEIDVVEDDD